MSGYLNPYVEYNSIKDERPGLFRWMWGRCLFLCIPRAFFEVTKGVWYQLNLKQIALLDTSRSQSREFPPFPVGLAHQRIRCFRIRKAQIRRIPLQLHARHAHRIRPQQHRLRHSPGISPVTQRRFPAVLIAHRGREISVMITPGPSAAEPLLWPLSRR